MKGKCTVTDKKRIRIQIDCYHHLREIDHIVDDLKKAFLQWHPIVDLDPQRCQLTHTDRVCLSSGSRFVQVLNVLDGQYVAVRIALGEVLGKYYIGVNDVTTMKEAIDVEAKHK